MVPLSAHIALAPQDVSARKMHERFAWLVRL